jgi:hypothetical protein
LRIVSDFNFVLSLLKLKVFQFRETLVAGPGFFELTIVAEFIDFRLKRNTAWLRGQGTYISWWMVGYSVCWGIRTLFYFNQT